MRGNGKAFAAIAAALGKTRCAVIGMADRKGLLGDGRPHKRYDDDLATLWDEGVSSVEIGKVLGLHRKTISARAKKIGLAPRERKRAAYVAAPRPKIKLPGRLVRFVLGLSY